MKKADRQALVKELLDDGVEENEIIIEVTTQSGASEATVKKDIKELSEDNSESEEGVIVKIIELSEDEKANAELAKGRKTTYEVQVKDQGSVHIELENVQSGKNMRKTSKPHVAMIDPKQWDKFRKQIILLGYDHYRILYHPEGMTEAQLEIPDPRKEKPAQ